MLPILAAFIVGSRSSASLSFLGMGISIPGVQLFVAYGPYSRSNRLRADRTNSQKLNHPWVRFLVALLSVRPHWLSYIYLLPLTSYPDNLLNGLQTTHSSTISTTTTTITSYSTMLHDHVAKEATFDNGVSTDNHEGGPFEPSMQPLRSVGTADTVTIPKSVFEGMYLNPPTPLKNQMRKNLGNPTPMCVVLSADLANC